MVQGTGAVGACTVANTICTPMARRRELAGRSPMLERAQTDAPERRLVACLIVYRWNLCESGSTALSLCRTIAKCADCSTAAEWTRR